MSVIGRVVNTDHGGTTLTVLENLPDLSYTFNRSDVGTASWSVPFSHPNLQAVSSLGPTGFGPKLTDFRIGVSSTGATGTWVTVQGGFCGPVGLQSGRSTIAVAGVDWLAWLNQPYRFNIYESNVKSAADVVAYNINQTEDVIIDDILAHLWDAGNPTESVHITAEYLPSVASFDQNIIDHIVIAGDNSTALDHIKAIGAYNEPYGFEFWMHHDKTLQLWAPRRVSYVTATVTETFRYSSGSVNYTSVTWENTGPIATTTIGQHSGLYEFSTYAPSRLVYRDWWQIKEFANINLIIDLNQFAAATDSVGKHDRAPQRNVTMTFRPEDVPTEGDPLFWFRNQLGKCIYVDSETEFQPYFRIQTKFWIDSQTLTCDDVGNWTCTLKLEQIYSTS